MIKRKVRLKITASSRQTLRRAAGGLRAHCPLCLREAELVSEDEAVEILQIDNPALANLVAAGYVHTIQTVSGNLRVCKDSLFQSRR